MRGYKPPVDVEDRLQALTEDVFGEGSDWRNQPLNDKYKKYHVRFIFSYFVIKLLQWMAIVIFKPAIDRAVIGF